MRFTGQFGPAIPTSTIRAHSAFVSLRTTGSADSSAVIDGATGAEGPATSVTGPHPAINAPMRTKAPAAIRIRRA